MTKKTKKQKMPNKSESTQAKRHYKKIIAVITSIAIIFLVAEGIVNYLITESDLCGLEKHEIFKNLPQDTKKQRCLNIFGLDYVFDRVAISREVIHINSEGFRGLEFSPEKLEKTYRIFMIGGSTTYGDGIENNGTIPFFLQKKFDEIDLDFNIEVINTGIPKAFSEGEVKLIKNRLLQYDPDLFVVYDGWNDLHFHSEGITNENMWFERWKEICNLGKNQDFDVVVIIQPIAGTGNRIMTQQEYEFYLSEENEELLKFYPLYLSKLNELSNYCTKTADQTNIFDNVSEAIYYDQGHQGIRGSQIIAENIFELIFPVVTGNEYAVQMNNIESTITKPIYKTPLLYHMFGLVDKFTATMPKKLDYAQLNLLYRNYEGQDLRKFILFDAENIRNYFSYANLANTNLSGVDLSGWDLRGAILEGTDLSYASLDGTNLVDVNLKNAKLEGVNLSKKDLRGVNLSGIDLSGYDLSEVMLVGGQLVNTNLSKTNLSKAVLIGIDFSNTNLSNANLSEAVFVGRITEQGVIAGESWQDIRYPIDPFHVGPISQYRVADFANANLENADFTNTILTYVNFTNANLNGSILDCIGNSICN